MVDSFPRSGIRVIRQTFARRPLTVRTRQVLIGYLFVLPAVVFFLIFLIYPLVRGLVMSLQEYYIGAPSKPFIGLANYGRVAADPDFWTALQNTFEYTATYVPAVIGVSLLLALLLNAIHKGAAIYRAIYFAPVMTAGVAVAIIWRYVMHPSLGLANGVLRALGLPPSDWLVGASTAMPSMVLVSVWESMGFQVILFLAGLQSIPPHLYDAARIDGAGRWQSFRYITWPLLHHTTLFVTVTTIINSFQIFTLAFMFGRLGGPGKSLLVMVAYIQHWVMGRGNAGYGAAMAFVLFAIIMLFTVLQLLLLKARWEY
jgi:multiple sugar transport system permease protein